MKKWLTYVSLGAILFFSVFGALTLAGMERSYEGQAAAGLSTITGLSRA